MFKRILIIFLFFLSVSKGYCCYCFDTLSTSQRIEYELNQRYSVIFSGKLVETRIDSLLFYTSNKNLEVFNFQLINSWRGLSDNSEMISVYTRGGSCGAYFEKDSTYLIFGKAVEGGTVLPFVYTDECTRTKPLNKAKEDLELLGTGKTHIIHNKEFKSVDKDYYISRWFIVSLGLNLLLIILLIKKNNIT